MNWWERERLLTEMDKRAIEKAKAQDWTEIDENSAETEYGKEVLKEMISRKYHNDEYSAGME